MKAIVTQVPFATFGTIEGLMYEDGSFAIALPHVSEKFSVPQKNSARTVKTLLGKGFQYLKATTKLNPKEVNAISLLDFQRLILLLANSGNKEAAIFRDAMFGLALDVVFKQAFKIEIKEQETQLKLAEAFHHAKNFHPTYTKWLQLDGIEHGFRYGNEVNRLKACANLPLVPITEYDGDQLRALNIAEANYNVLRKIGKEHKEALALI